MKRHKRSIKSIIVYMVISACLACINIACKPEIEEKHIVGIVNPSSGLTEVVKGFKEGMEKLGYQEGKNITYLYEGPLKGVEQADEKINDLIEKNVDLIYSLTTPASKKLNKALTGTTIPGVFGPVFDPVRSGILKSLAVPEGQITGVKVRGSTTKALEWLLAIVPDVKKIFIPFHKSNKAASLTLEDLQKTVSKFDIELITEEVSTDEDLELALTKIPADADAVWLTCSHLLFSNVDKIVKAADDRKIPVASSTHSRQRSGILVTYGEHDNYLGAQISQMADKLLKGKLIKEVPSENANYFLGINLKTAGNLGIDVPESIIKQADFIEK